MCEYRYATTGGSQVWQPTLQPQLVLHSPYRYGEIPVIHLIGQETEKSSMVLFTHGCYIKYEGTHPYLFFGSQRWKKITQNTSQIRNNKHGIAEIGTTWFLCMYINIQNITVLKNHANPSPPQKYGSSVAGKYSFGDKE